PTDGGGSDGAIVTPVTPNSVTCGAMSCMTMINGVCCPGMNLMCSNFMCMTGDTFACDGPEDCAAKPCCFDGTTASCATGGNCKGTDTVICHSAADCPMAAPFCCPNVTLPAPSFTFGTCDKTAC